MPALSSTGQLPRGTFHIQRTGSLPLSHTAYDGRRRFKSAMERGGCAGAADTCTSGADAAAQTSQPEADRVFTDYVKDFEDGRTCASQVWKLQHMQRRFMKKTAPECLFYEKNSTKNHVLWKFVVLYGNFVSFLWKFVVLYGNFVSFYGNLL